MNRYYFQALDAGNEPVAEQTAHQMHSVVSEETLEENARQIARSMMHEWPDDAPWTDWSIEIGTKLDHQTEWTRRQIKFQELLGG